MDKKCVGKLLCYKRTMTFQDVVLLVNNQLQGGTSVFHWASLTPSVDYFPKSAYPQRFHSLHN